MDPNPEENMPAKKPEPVARRSVLASSAASALQRAHRMLPELQGDAWQRVRMAVAELETKLMKYDRAVRASGGARDELRTAIATVSREMDHHGSRAPDRTRRSKPVRGMAVWLLVGAFAPLGVQPLAAQEPRPVPDAPIEAADRKVPALRRAFLELLDKLAKAEQAESRARDAVAEAVALPEKARRTEALEARVSETAAIRRRLAALRGHPDTRALVRKASTVAKSWHHLFVGVGPDWVARTVRPAASPSDGRPDPAAPRGTITPVFWSAVDASAKKRPDAFTLVFAVTDKAGARRATVRVPHRALEQWGADRTAERVTLVPIAMPADAKPTWRAELIAVEKPKPSPKKPRSPETTP